MARPPRGRRRRYGWGQSGGGAPSVNPGAVVTLNGSSIAENAVAGTVVGTLTAVPSIAELTLLNDAGGRFVLEGDQIVAGDVPTDYEAQASHQIVVRAELGLIATDYAFTIAVLDVTEITNLTLSGAATVVSGWPAGIVVGGLTSSPAGAAFTLTDSAGGRFALSGTNIVTGSVPTDYDVATSHSVTVEALLSGETLTKTFDITVANAITISAINLSAATIAENAGAGVIVGALTSVPPGAVLTLTNTAGNRFAITGGNLVRGSAGLDFETAESHIVTVRGVLDAGEPHESEMTQDFTIAVTNVNEITAINLSASTIAENAVQGAVVGGLTSTPPGAAFTMVNTAGNRFAITGNNLVRGVTGLDYEAASSHDISIKAALGADEFSQPFTITVTDVDEITDITLTPAAISESAAAGAVVGALASVPAGATFALTGNAGNRFALSGGNIVRGATALDYETDTSHDIVVRGTRQGETLDKTLTVSVTNVNEIDSVSLSANTITESAAANAVVGALSSSPAGATFTLTNNAGNRFAIVGGNVVRGATALDYEAATSHQIEVRAALGADVLLQTFTINVTDVTEITNIALSANSISENAAAGAVVGALTSTPTGASFAITATAGSRFALSGNNVVRGAAALDYETATSHEITIAGTRQGETISRNFTINVTDEDELASINLSSSSISEGAAVNAVVGALTSTPTGAVLTLTDNAGGRFAISGGNLVRAATALDYETATSHSVTVSGTRQGKTIEQAFTITVTNVAEITDIALSANTIAEDAGAGVVVGALSSTPAGAAFTLTGTAGNRFALSGNNVVRGATALDYETATSHLITVQGARGGETLSEDFTINVTDVSEGPPTMVPDNLSVSPGVSGTFGSSATPPVSAASTAFPNGSGSGTGYSYFWETISGPIIITSPNSATTTFTIPDTPVKPGAVNGTVRLTVTDSLGAVLVREYPLTFTWN